MLHLAEIIITLQYKGFATASEILTKEKGFHYEHHLKSAVTKIKNVSGIKHDTVFKLDSVHDTEVMENKINKILQAVESEDL